MLCQRGFLFERATLFASEVTVSQVSNILIITLLKRLKEHFDYTSDLTWKKNMLDIYTNMDCVMCQKRKDATLFDGIENYQTTDD